ncbi:protein-disulfide reductase DsbD [Castellaniella hirudinis]|uniref:protein-disulfide reductase DsbD n=1 Tax=Castellaniella hirudinis TaxID=1144617 RepID=UPI0039C03249
MVVRFFLAVWLLLGLLGPAQAEDGFLDPEVAFVATAAMPDPQTLDVHYQIAPGYYMYQERFEVRIEDAQGRLLLFLRSALTPDDAEPRQPAWDSAVRLPKGQVKYDPTFEQDMAVFHNGVTLRVPLRPGAPGPLRVSVTGQGCSDKGLCYPPMTQDLTLVARADGYQAKGPLVRDQVPAPRDEAPAAGAAMSPAAGGLDLLAAPASVFSPAAPVSTPAAADATAPADAPVGWLDMGDMGMAAWLHQAPLWQILGLSFLLGLLLSFTPCVLPMVPILLAIIAGKQPGQIGRGRGLGLAAAYVLGMSLVYTALGVAAGLLGAGLAAWLQSPWVLGSFALLLAVFALAMLDVFTLQSPVGLQSRLLAWQQALPGGQVGGVFLMGMLSALIVGPCVAAPLAGVLLFISQTGDVLIGAGALFALAWGEGLLLLLVGAGAGALLPRAGAWMGVLKSIFGLLLLATAWWMAQPLLADALAVAGWVLLAFWAALMIWGAVQGAGAAGAMGLLARALALMLALWGLAQGAGLLAGGDDMLRPLAPFRGGAVVAAGSGAGFDAPAVRARFTPVASVAELDAQLRTADRPVMLDFYADWCVSCLEMEKFTFSDPRVAQRMGQMLLLQADVTRMTADDKALLARFHLFGPPGILFFDRHGQLLPQARVIGFKKADAFLAVQAQVLGASR